MSRVGCLRTSLLAPGGGYPVWFRGAETRVSTCGPVWSGITTAPRAGLQALLLQGPSCL